jgi:FkbM family methyltransferase
MRKLVSKLKSSMKAFLGKELHVKLDVECEKERLGSGYGGWELVTKDLDSSSIVYSFGIGEDATFDLALIEKYGLIVHAFDPTPKSIEWVKTQGFPPNFVLHEYGIAAFDGEISFNPPENPDHVSHTILDRPSTKSRAISVSVKRIQTIVQQLNHTQIDVLKMDIEGAEYDVIEDIFRSQIRPKQILVEYHHRFPGVGIKKTKESIERLRSMGYRLFSISATNEEFSFIRK